MIDGSEVIGFAINDFGVRATINGGPGTIAVILNPDGETVLDGELIKHTGPFALAKKADIEALGIEAGNDGDTVTIGGVDYTVLTIDPDGSGLVMISLEEQP